MRIEELREKTEKAREAVTKAENTIERHQKQAEKKLSVIKEHGWDPEDRYCRQGTPEHNDAYWAICEYRSKLEDIKNATNKLEDKKRILAGWEEKLMHAKRTEILFSEKVPEAFKDLEANLVSAWDEGDKYRREYLNKQYEELGYKDFIKKHRYSGYEFLRITDEEIHKANERDARSLILDLYARVYKITGEAESWIHITCAGTALNGFVKGENGTCKVESILAGGYNIQRLHVRVLTHKIA